VPEVIPAKGLINMNSAASALQVVHSPQTDDEHGKVYRDAIASERQAESDSIIAAWEAGHTFRRFEDPVSRISELTGVGTAYIQMRIRLAGNFTKAQLIQAIDRSGATHFTAFYSWAFHTGTHQSNQMFRHRNVHVPEVHWKYFESMHIDISARMKELLEVIPPSELHGLLKKYVLET